MIKIFPLKERYVWAEFLVSIASTWVWSQGTFYGSLLLKVLAVTKCWC